MNAYHLGLSALLGLGISMVVMELILRVYRQFRFSHREEMHHGHGASVPRFGGIALASAFFAVLAVTTSFWNGADPDGQQLWEIAIFSLLMFGLGLWDDFRSLGAKRKFWGQLLIASAAYYWGIGIHKFQIPFSGVIIDLGFWSWVVTVFWLVGMTNLMNLIDGIDGLAGGIALMLMVLMAYVGSATGGVGLAAAGMVGALLGFLRYNFPPARIYMGDGGAYFLGFLIGCMTIVSSQKGTIFAALTAPLFVLALPILDTSLAILRRGARGLPLFRPDRRHLHHRLLESGLSQRTVVLGFYVFTAFFLLLGFAACWMQGQHFELLIGIGILVILLVAGKFNFSREWFAVGRVLGNSLETRSEVQYAIAQIRWLVLDGHRTESIHELCDDLAFIARKLGYARLHIQLEDGKKTWEINPVKEENCYHFQHRLPGNKLCSLELFAPRRAAEPGAADSRGTDRGTYSILSDLLAEGWSKAIRIWHIKNELPVRFDANVNQPATAKPAATMGTTLPAAAES